MSKKSSALPDQQTIDMLYGLEPVYEPAGSVDSLNANGFVAVQCPYCGEGFETAVDLSAGAFCYVEDCQVCCRPIELTSEIDERGVFAGVSARRAD